MKKQNNRKTMPICKAAAVTGIVAGMLGTPALANITNADSVNASRPSVISSNISAEDEFEQFRAAAMPELIKIVPEEDRPEYEDIFNQCNDYLNDYQYNNSISYYDNQDAFRDRVLECEALIRTEMAHREFEEFRSQAMVMLVNLVPEEERPSYEDLFNTCSNYLNSYAYNDSISLTDNQSAFVPYVLECEKLINGNMDADAFNIFKQEGMQHLIEMVPEQERPSYETVFNTCQQRINAFQYNSDLTLEANRSAFAQVIVECENYINREQDHREFETFKDEGMQHIIEMVPADDRPSYEQIFLTIGDGIAAFSYNNDLTLEDNKNAFRSYLAECEALVNLEMNRRAFEEIKEEGIRALAATSATSPNFEEAVAAFNALTYNENLTASENMSVLFRNYAIMQAYCETDNVSMEPLNIPTYRILSGSDSAWDGSAENASEGITFTCEGNSADFSGVIVDGTEVPEDGFTFSEETGCTLKDSFLAGLENGEHTFVYYYATGISEVVRFSTTAPAQDPSEEQQGSGNSGNTENNSEETAAPSESGIAGFVERLYTVALERQSDPVGKSDWVESVTERGQSGADLARGFLYSPEFLNKNHTNEEFVTILYRTFFDREPDAEGFNAWVAALNNGTPKQEIIEGFINSTEWANLCVIYGVRNGASGVPNITVEPNQQTIDFCTRLYTTCLGRDAEEEGLMAWARQLANQRDSGTGAAHGFFFSEEFTNQNVSNEEFLARLYRTFMDREPDEAGFNAWLEQLNGGTSREEIFNGFSRSQEFARICAAYGIIREM